MNELRDWLTIIIACLLTICIVWALGMLGNRMLYVSMDESDLERLNARLDQCGPYYVYEFLPDGETVRFVDGQGVTRTLRIGGE